MNPRTLLASVLALFVLAHTATADAAENAETGEGVSNLTADGNLRSKLSDLFRSVKTNLTANKSSRNGATIIGSVVHTTESADGSLMGIVGYFKGAGTPASSHYVLADTPAPGAKWVEVVRMVWEKDKAWTARSANPVTVNYELVGRASRSRAQWLGAYRTQIRTLAALIAEDCLQYGYPVRHDIPGVAGHGDLNAQGYPNTHTDPGPGFPWDVFMADVAYYYSLGKQVEPPAPTPVVTKPRILGPGHITSGDAVAALQKDLNLVGYGLAVTARYDAATEAAVKTFQRRNRLTPDGLCGPATFATLAVVVTREFRSNGHVSKTEWRVARWYLGIGEYAKYGRRNESVRPNVGRKFTSDTWHAVDWYIRNVVRKGDS